MEHTLKMSNDIFTYNLDFDRFIWAIEESKIFQISGSRENKLQIVHMIEYQKKMIDHYCRLRYNSNAQNDILFKMS